MRSHIEEGGNLRPANPEGKATIQQHIRGSDPAKANSPYTSFSEPTSSAKSYGGSSIRLDKARLQSDIASGKVKGVRVIEHDKVVDALKKHIADAKSRYGSNKTRKSLGRLEAAKRDLQNATRDREFLIEGIIPKSYFNVTPNN